MYYALKDLQKKSPGPGVEMRPIHGDRMTLVFFHLQTDGAVPEHHHPHEQMGTVLSGTMELTIDGQRRTLSKGDIYHVPPDVIHSGRCLEGPAEVLEVFSPVREDFK
jgi:quercetin dioxygenase-like cupin family protein